MKDSFTIEFFTSKKMLVFFVGPVVVLCAIFAGLDYREFAKAVQLEHLRSGSPYAKIILNSSRFLNEKYPLHRSLSEKSIGKVKFLEPQELKDNTDTAIIVLGDRPLNDTTPTVDMVYRVLKGVALAKKFTRAVVIMTGGATKSPTPEAQMIGLIAWSRGVDPLRIILENKSQTTGENAEYTANIIGSKNIRQVFIITEPSRLEEAVAFFKKHEREFKNVQGVESDVTSALIIEQMKRFLMSHDDRVVRGRLHYV